MQDASEKAVAAALGCGVESLTLIGKNAYCRVYLADTGRGRVIVKKYKGEDPSLAAAEGDALAFYDRVAQEDDRLMACRALVFDAQANLLCIHFTPGERFSALVYQGLWRGEARERSIRFMGLLGETLKRFYEETVSPGGESAQTPFEYLRYCSQRLESIPVLGGALFRGLRDDAERLCRAFRAADLAPSFAHGDFVFRNMHVCKERIGLIDFANSLPNSHALNDAYALHFALRNMPLPGAYRAALADAFRRGFGDAEFPEVAREFYYEYHRRRWLALKLRTLNPLRWAQAARGLAAFAGPFSPDEPPPIAAAD